jgi:adenylate cyclase
MMASRPERRLAAIMVADVVGYSRLMGRDDAGTLARLTACRIELLEPLVSEYRGRIINFPGDNALCEFASVVDAVECAVSIQRRVADRERDFSRPDRIYFRIGVNLADILAEERGVYGDGVNVAARLEQLCEPGGVVVSGTAYDHLRGRFDRELEFVGERRLKNIERPVRVYRVVVALTSVAPLPRPEERPSIAVLPFANMGKAPDQDYFSDGIADDLITDLTKVSGLFVASRHTAFALKGTQVDLREAGPRLGVRHLLLGSLRRFGERIRLTTQLVDSDTGEYLWAERFDRVLTDVFAVQDETTRTIVDVLRVKLLPGEDDALRRAPSRNIDAYQLYLRGQQLFRQRSRHGYEVARRLFTQVVSLDQGFARAYAGIAECEACLALHHGGLLPIRETLAMAELALRLEPSWGAAHVARGLALVAQGRLEEAEQAYECAIALVPEHYEAHYAYARLCFQRGQKDVAAHLFRRATAMRPNDIYAPLILMGIERGLKQIEKSRATARLVLGRAELELEQQPENGLAAYAAAHALATLGDGERAMRFAAHALALEPNDHPVQYNVACTYSLLGELEQALDVLEHTMPSAPAYRWAWLAQDADFDPLRSHPRFAALLRRAPDPGGSDPG